MYIDGIDEMSGAYQNNCPLMTTTYRDMINARLADTEGVRTAWLAAWQAAGTYAAVGDRLRSGYKGDN